MRYGYSKQLAEYVESVPQLARPIVETVVTTASDIKDTKGDFGGADSTSGFKVFDEGGIRLGGAGTTSVLSNTTRLAGADITSLVPPTQSPLGVAVVEWGNTTLVGQSTEIFGATAYLDPANGGAKEVTDWFASIYRFDSVSLIGDEEVWNLQWLGSDSVTATGSAPRANSISVK